MTRTTENKKLNGHIYKVTIDTTRQGDYLVSRFYAYRTYKSNGKTKNDILNGNVSAEILDMDESIYTKRVLKNISKIFEMAMAEKQVESNVKFFVSVWMNDNDKEYGACGIIKEKESEENKMTKTTETNDRPVLTTRIRKEVRNYARAELKVKDDHIACQYFREINNICMKSEFFISIKTIGPVAKEYLLNNLSLVIETIRNPLRMKENGFEAIRVTGRMDVNGRETLDLIIKQDEYEIRTGGYGDYNDGDNEHALYLSYVQVAKEYTLFSDKKENVSRETPVLPVTNTKKFTTNYGKKVTGTLIDQWDNGDFQAAKLYDMGNSKELLIAIYTRPNTRVVAEIILDQQFNAILDLLKHPQKITDTQIEKIMVHYYVRNEKDEKSNDILKLTITDKDINYRWGNRLKVDMYTADAESRNSEYIFYNRKRLMFSAWNFRKTFLKKGVNIPLSICLKYFVSQERFYQGFYSSFEEATKETGKPILDILHQKSEPVQEKRQERTIKYSIPYRLFKSSEKGGLYDFISYFDGAIEETDRNYNKSTKEMEFTFKITSDSYKEARRFGYDEETFDNVVSSTKICFLNHYKEELKQHGMELTNHLLTNDTESRKEYVDHKLETGKITKETYEWFMSFHDGLLIPVLN